MCSFPEGGEALHEGVDRLAHRPLDATKLDLTLPRLQVGRGVVSDEEGGSCLEAVSRGRANAEFISGFADSGGDTRVLH